MIDTFAKKYNLQNFRIKQFNQQYYKDYISSWDELTTWPKDLREELKKQIPFSNIELRSLEKSKDNKTLKAIFTTPKGNYIESVLIKEKYRNTVCVSCMSGCPVGCIFCATGQMGLKENLSSEQIVDQVLFFARILKISDEHITNIVYMGMGEPMLNLESVAHSIKVLIDKDMFGLGHRRITVSTSGYVKQLLDFINMKLGVKLAISLHSPDQELRDKLMPNVSPNNKLEELFNTLDLFVEQTNKRITYEYVMLDGINDSEEYANMLVDLLKNRLALVNLIPYNSTPDSDFRESKNTYRFQDILLSKGVNTTIRKSYGQDISGACGQLVKKISS